MYTEIKSYHDDLIKAGAIYFGEWMGKKWYEAPNNIVLKKINDLFDDEDYMNDNSGIDGYSADWITMNLLGLTGKVCSSKRMYWYTTTNNINAMREWGCRLEEDPSIVDAL